ncbi:LOW QUALITY PROTEIN: Exostosin, GT47 domain [Dillenia turbinata]|uniref:Exostosin, GT47 domain n=1 Tax=Dillenia turbinata TaxID=194707 RepID=A0AAN8ZPB1_9MAGN
MWVYNEGEAPLVHSGPMHGIYSIEGHFIDEIFIASHPDEAHAFFLPISVASIVDYVYKPITTYARDQLLRVVADYIRLVADKYPYWNRSGGADHFLVACHDWGPDVSEANPERYKNVMRVLCNANTSERFGPKRDVSMPDFSLQIPVHKIPEIKAILRGIPFAKYLRMQKGVRRHFELNRPAEPFDVMHMVLHSVWLRRLNVRIPF